MLLRITKHCTMRCSHCLGDFVPDNKHMTAETLAAALKFIVQQQVLVIIITGGEPLEHPEAEEFISAVVNVLSPAQVIVCSNGEHLTAELAARLSCTIQVVNDSRYYPRRVIPFKAENVEFFTEIPAPIYPVGRAAKNNIQGARLSPSCFNFRSIIRNAQGFDLAQTIKMLETRGKFCTPVIDWDGGILLGETCCCTAVGSIWDSPEELTRKIRAFGCRSCGLDVNLTAEYKAAVWG